MATKAKPINTKFHFDFSDTISQGDLWSEVYACAAKAINNNERFCKNAFETQVGDNGNIGCASTAIALELNEHETIYQELKIKPKFKNVDGIKYWYFDLDDSAEKIYILIARWLRDNFTEEEIKTLKENMSPYSRQHQQEYISNAIIVAKALTDFVIQENDSYIHGYGDDDDIISDLEERYHEVRYKLIEKYGSFREIPQEALAKLPKVWYHPKILAAQKARAKHVKRALLEASKEAKKLGNKKIKVPA